MRRSVYSSDSSTVFGEATAVAGSDQSVESVTSITTLDGTGSSTTGGSITAYLWTIISGTGLVLDSPTSSTTTVSGTSVVGDSVIQLKVTDTNGNTDIDTLTISIVLGDPLTVVFTQPDGGGQGTITYSNGQANEVLDLAFALFNGNHPDSITFTGGVMVGLLNYSSTSSVGSITLDGSGDGSTTYNGVGDNFQVTVTTTGRSSAYPLPTLSERVADISFYS